MGKQYCANVTHRFFYLIIIDKIYLLIAISHWGWTKFLILIHSLVNKHSNCALYIYILIFSGIFR